jgi:hypothetical protein
MFEFDSGKFPIWQIWIENGECETDGVREILTWRFRLVVSGRSNHRNTPLSGGATVQSGQGGMRDEGSGKRAG